MGKKVTLVTEPDNPFEPNAVSNYFKGTKSGYIPQKYNVYISSLRYLRHRNILEARINFCNIENNTENQYGAVVKLEDNRIIELEGYI